MDTSAQPSSFQPADSQDTAAQPANGGAKESVRDQMERILRSNLDIAHLVSCQAESICSYEAD